MSLIEQAAKRLEQLRQAGVEFPPDDLPRAPPSRTAVPPEVVTADRLLHQQSQLRADPRDASRTPREVAAAETEPPVPAGSLSGVHFQSKRVDIDLKAAAALSVLRGLTSLHLGQNQLGQDAGIGIQHAWDMANSALTWGLVRAIAAFLAPLERPGQPF